MLRLLTKKYEFYPYLHWEPDHVFNPLTNERCERGDELYPLLRIAQRNGLKKLTISQLRMLANDEWVFPQGKEDCESVRLRFAEIETTSTCNQSCYFCPVAVAPRSPKRMELELFEKIIRQLTEHHRTLRLVNLFRYNEPTLDKRLPQLVELVRAHGLPPGFNTNATGLTPKLIERLKSVGGLRFISINLSTLDESRYEKERQHNHLDRVLRNLDYLSRNPIADRIDLAVLGRSDDQHLMDYESICERFRASPFNISSFEIMNRGGNVDLEGLPNCQATGSPLRGCMQTGSRPLQWVHITPEGLCVICCQDYHEEHVLGDLKKESLHEILNGSKFAEVRDWVYGKKPCLPDFICSKCSFARNLNYEDDECG